MGNSVNRVIHTLSNGKWCAEERRILMIGLDAAGKTTILYKMILGEIVKAIPTIGFNVETLNVGGVKLTTWDVGYGEKMRPLWRHYYPNTDALLFVVDSNDRERMEEASDLFNSIIMENDLIDAICLVIANKQDLSGAMSTTEIAEALKLHKVKQRCKILPTAAPTGLGLDEAFDWLVHVLRGGDMNHWTPLDKDTDKTVSKAPSWTEWLMSFLKPISNVQQTDKNSLNSGSVKT